MLTKLFGFGLPIKNILTICDSEPVHVFWKDKSLRKCLGCNTIQANFIKQNTGCSNVIGRTFFDMFPYNEARMGELNDRKAIKDTTIKLFAERGFGRDCLSFKTQLRDSANNIIGIFGLAFYLDEITLSKTVYMINKLNLSMLQTDLQTTLLERYFSVNASLFSKREQECIYYLFKGMTAKEIGKILKISFRTVQAHIDHIKCKLNCNSSMQIIAKIIHGNK